MNRSARIRSSLLAWLPVSLASTAALAGGNGPYLVKDINPNGFSFPIELTKVGDRLFFNADDGVHGQELWVSDGTEAGTYMVIDLIPGPDGSVPQRIIELNGQALFQVDDNVDGMQWFISDGTAAGTVSVASVEQGGPGIALNTCGFWGIEAESVGKVVFFEGDDPAHGKEIWKTDGTSLGTMLVKDVRPGPPDSSIQTLTRVGPLLYFASPYGGSNSGFNPWRSDGTTAGTIMLADISGAIKFTDINGTAFFRGEESSSDEELWISDGSVAGTRLVKDINPGLNPSTPDLLTNVNGIVFFSAFAAGFGRELWKSDGTQAGTVMVADITPGSGSGEIGRLTNVDGRLFFRRQAPGIGWQIWTSDGTAEGTTLVKTIGPEDSDAPDFLIAGQGKLFFAGDDGIHGVELWVSDGTSAGTHMVWDTAPGTTSHFPWIPVVVGSTLFYAATDGVDGAELWALDLSDPIPAMNDLGMILLSIAIPVAGYWLIRVRKPIT